MVKVTGVENVISNINSFTHKELSRIEKAVIHWARNTSNMSKKLAPSDTGNLRRTGFFDYSKDSASIYARAGFTAKYAPAVHEILNPSTGRKRTSGSKRGFYWDVGQPKFLEIPARKNLQRLNQMFRGR